MMITIPINADVRAPVSYIVKTTVTPMYTGSNGLYVKADLDIISPNTLEYVTDILGVELDREDLHVTVMYSEVPIDKSATYYGNKVLSATCIEVTHWVGHNDKTYVVAKLQSEDLIAAHSYYRGLGAVPTFVPYQPHITLFKIEELPEDFEDKIKAANNWLADNPIHFDLSLQWPEDLRDGD